MFMFYWKTAKRAYFLIEFSVHIRDLHQAASSFCVKANLCANGEESVPGPQQMVPPFISVQVWLLHPDVYRFLDAPLFPVWFLVKEFYIVYVQLLFSSKLWTFIQFKLMDKEPIHILTYSRLFHPCLAYPISLLSGIPMTSHLTCVSNTSSLLPHFCLTSQVWHTQDDLTCVWHCKPNLSTCVWHIQFNKICSPCHSNWNNTVIGFLLQ